MRDYNADRKTGQYVVRRREPTKVYSYLPPPKKDPRKEAPKKGSSSVLDTFVWFARLFMLLLCAAATAYLFYLSYPKHTNYIIGWVALAPFVFGARKIKTFWGAGIYSLISGMAVFGALDYWVYYTCQAGGLPHNLSIWATVGFAFVMSLQFLGFGIGCFILRKTHLTFAFFAATTWVLFEYLGQLGSYHFFGPWGIFALGYTQAGAPHMVQIAAYTGVYGVSFALAFLGSEVGTVFSTKDFTTRAVSLFAAAAMFCGIFFYGKQVLKENRVMKAETSLKVAVLQPNIDLYKKWDAAFVEEIEATLADQINTAYQQSPDIIAWPESALPGSIYEEKYLGWVKEIAEKTQSWQLIGSDRIENGEQFVSAYLVNPEGQFAGAYDKMVLVPFGEYIPFEERLKNLNLDIQVLNALGSFTPGLKTQVPLYYKDIMLSAPICYESFFPAIWREAALNGARFFINITNDGWYLDTSAPYQNFAVNVLRAVETGRPVVRAANTGISGWIDRYGRVQKATTLNTKDVLVFDVPLQGENVQTFYNRFGDLFAIVCIIFALTGLGAALVFLYE